MFPDTGPLELAATRRNVFGELLVAVAISLLVFLSALFLNGSSVAGSQMKLLQMAQDQAAPTHPAAADSQTGTTLLAQPAATPAIARPPLQPANVPAAEPVAPPPSPTPTPLPVAVVVSPPTATPVPPLPTATPEPIVEPVVAPPAAQPPTSAVLDVSLTAFEADIVVGVNNERIAAGLAPLQIDGSLVGVARERSRDMVAQNYFSHTSPQGTTAFLLLDAYGIPYIYAGENLARNNYPDSQSVAIAMRDWMASEGHRRNMLNPHYTKIGVGSAADPSGIKYFTCVFTD
jgi:uncharacterized protein YkwD